MLVWATLALFIVAALALAALWRQRRRERQDIGAKHKPTHYNQAWVQRLDRTAAPDEEIIGPIHMMLSPHQMACGAPEGMGVFGFEASRVSCEMCKEWIADNRGPRVT